VIQPTQPASGLVWRHPRPQGHHGRCIGRTDLRVDPRKARRLARRIDAHARQHGLPRWVVTSPLRRTAAVGRALRRLGWCHVVDEALLEADFGAWDGQAWSDIPVSEVDAWVADFADHAPGGGESLRAVMRRAAVWSAPVPGATVVGHAGWMLARQWVVQHGLDRLPQAAEWPAPPAYGAACSIPVTSLACSSP
jgi:alpha-ribazole phosphatase